MLCLLTEQGIQTNLNQTREIVNKMVEKSWEKGVVLVYYWLVSALVILLESNRTLNY